MAWNREKERTHPVCLQLSEVCQYSRTRRHFKGFLVCVHEKEPALAPPVRTLEVKLRVNYYRSLSVTWTSGRPWGIFLDYSFLLMLARSMSCRYFQRFQDHSVHSHFGFLAFLPRIYPLGNADVILGLCSHPRRNMMVVLLVGGGAGGGGL